MSRRALESPVLLNIAELPFSDQKRRNQRLFQSILEDGSLFRDGIYVDPPQVARPPLPAPRLVRLFFSPLRELDGGHVRVAAPSFPLPFSWREPVARLQLRVLANRLAGALNERSYCLWVNSVELHSFLLSEMLRPKACRMILDISDDFTAFKNREGAAVDRRLSSLVESADAVIAVNDHVARKFPHPRSIVFGNGTDFEAMQRYDPAFRLGDVLPKTSPRPYVGFVGGLHRGRVDEPLLLAVVDAFPEALFLFVGYSNDAQLLGRLGSRPNVHVFPSVPYEQLPSVIRSFDAAIIPHLDNEFTRGNDLLKLHDYLACGVPVVTTRASNVERYKDAVYLCSGPSAFIDELSKILRGATGHDPQPGLAIAARESWSNAIPKLTAWLKVVWSE